MVLPNLKIGGSFHGYVTNNQMENANDMGYNLFSDNPDDWGQESLSQKKNGSKCAAVWAPWTNDFSESWMVTDKTIWSKQTINLLPKTSNQQKSNTMDTKVFFLHLHHFRFSVCIARNRSSEPGR